MEWNTHPVYVNHLVSSLGEVYNTHSQRYNKGYPNKKGYILNNLWHNGKRIQIFNHRLVAQTYIPNPHNLPEVDHINGIRNDNRVSNLAWCDRSTNSSRWWRIYDINLDREIVIRNLMLFCQEHGLVRQNMEAVAKGINHQHKGYTCQYYTPTN